MGSPEEERRSIWLEQLEQQCEAMVSPIGSRGIKSAGRKQGR
jgi:hypothetical protein